MNSSTSTSKRWLLSYLVALLLAAGIGWVYASRFEPETQFWVEAFQKRRAEMTHRSDEPHVIFTGDSACSFGVNPEAFQSASGRASFNLGGTRQMGIDTFMEEALAQAREGDSIVLICNPDLLIGGANDFATKAGAQMALALPSESTFSEKIQASRPGFSHLITLAAKIGLGRPAFVYDMQDYREGGQVATEIRIEQNGSTQLFSKSADEVSAAAKTLHFWAERCRAKGITLQYLLPLELTDPSGLEQNRKGKQDFLQGLSESTQNVTILSMVNSGCSDDPSIFSDTFFHLTEEAARQFSAELAAIVSP